jgi:tetratricopeptide (TPR) repeat protein
LQHKKHKKYLYWNKQGRKLVYIRVGNNLNNKTHLKNENKTERRHNMKRVLTIAFCLCALFVKPICLFAEDFMAQGDMLYEQGKTNYEIYKQSGDMFAKASEANPSSYEAAWKAARSYREYADGSQLKNAPNWKDTCAKYGKLGMKYGEKAIVLNPNGVEGLYWYGCSVGDYADGVSVFTALKEGLKNKTQISFEKAYRINKMYDNGGPMIALGRFWSILPWPMHDKELALKYFREYQKSFPNDPRGQVWMAETLIDTGRKDEAKALLQKASVSGDKFFADQAKRLLAEM